MAQVGSGEDLPDLPESDDGDSGWTVCLETLPIPPAFWLHDLEQGLVLFDIFIRC